MSEKKEFTQEEVLANSKALKLALENMGWSFAIMTDMDGKQLDLMIAGKESEVQELLLTIDKANMYDELMEKYEKIKKKD